MEDNEVSSTNSKDDELPSDTDTAERNQEGGKELESETEDCEDKNDEEHAEESMKPSVDDDTKSDNDGGNEEEEEEEKNNYDTENLEDENDAESDKVDSDGDDADQSVTVPSNDEDEESKPKVPTDEYGRELSAYEIMRLERIRRNKAYLARLGLEEEKNGVRNSMEKELQQKKKERKKKADDDVFVERRQSMQRESKKRKVDYSGDLNAVLKPHLKRKVLSEEEKAKKATAKKSKRRDEMIPRFIYREFEHIKKCKNRAVTTGKRLVKAAEIECRIAKRNLEIHNKKQKRKIEKAEKRNAMATKKMLNPLVQELDSKRSQLIRAKKDFDAWSEKSIKSASNETNRLREALEKAKVEFPEAVLRNEYELGVLLHERLITQEEDAKTESKTKAKSKVKKGKATNPSAGGGKITGRQNVVSKNKDNENAAKILDKENGKIKENGAAEAKKSYQITKARNIGGPVTPALSSNVQRKWLDRDVPLPGEVSTSFVPQVGDMVLYYPCAHYEFLKGQPDIRCKKLRLTLRRPLWERAKDEKEIIKESKKKGMDELSKKTKILLQTKPWWTSEWINAIDSDAGAYPIVCRVEKAVAEFPYDAESLKEIRQFKYKVKKAQAGEEEYLGEDFKDPKQRRLVIRKKPSLGLNVTLRPISTIQSPIQSKRKNIFFEESKLSLPPVFSVLTSPCIQAPFLVPFVYAQRLSLSATHGDKVKLLENTCGTSHQGSIQNESIYRKNNISAILEMFIKIIHLDTCADLSSSNRLDAFIAKCYETDMNSGDINLPEADFRDVIAIALYQCHKRKISFTQCNHDIEGSISDRESGINNILKWIFMNLPRWKEVKITMDENGEEKFLSTWDFIVVDEKKQNYDDGILSAALAPSVLMASPLANFGGLVYSLDNNLRSDIASYIDQFTKKTVKASSFIASITDKIAPEYSRFVPVSMSFRRILRRLKTNQVKSSKHFVDFEDPLENLCSEESSTVCYYRSVGAVLSDIKDIFHNCLLYNDPDSDIVQDAFEVTNEMKVSILEMEADRLKQKKEERQQAHIATLVANGEEGFSLSRKSKMKHNTTTERLDEFFNGKISHLVALDRHSTTDSNNVCISHWFPQCGDKILYNRQLHARFIHGHFSSLSTEQRILPSILPRRKKKKQKETNVEKLDDCDDSQKYHNWLGTVLWVRTCFPTVPSSESRTFDKDTPIWAIGIQFHYNWLSRETHVVYWRPCRPHGSDQTKSSSNMCGFCGLDSKKSFITLGCNGNLDQLLPPFPLSLAKEIKSPTGLSKYSINKIDRCLTSLKQRIAGEFDVTSFKPNNSFAKALELHDIPSRFHYIFEDESNKFQEQDSNKEDIVDEQLSSSKSIQSLTDAAFIPIWTSVETLKDTVVTRGSNVSTGSNGHEILSYENLVSNPHICLDSIQKQNNQGHYRSIDAITHDIREAFLNSILFILKKRIHAKYINVESAQKIIQNILCSAKQSACEGRNSDDKDGIDLLDTTIPCPKLNVKEWNIYRRVVIVRKVYSVALLCVSESITTEIALGLDIQNIHDKVEGPTKDQMKLRKTLSKILSSLSQDRCSFRKPLAKTSPLPTVRINIIHPTDVGGGIDHNLESNALMNPNNGVILSPCDFENNSALICALFASGRKLVQVNVNISKTTLGKKIVLCDSDFLNNLPLVHALFRPLKKIVFVRAHVKSDYNLNKNPNETVEVESSQSIISSIKSNCSAPRTHTSSCSAGEESDDDYFDESKPINFLPKDYEENESLTQALLCRTKRKNICARCKVGRSGLLICRVRRAHSNLDFVWNEFIKNTGGVQGMIQKLQPGSTVSKTNLDLSSEKSSENFQAIQANANESTKRTPAHDTNEHIDPTAPEAVSLIKGKDAFAKDMDDDDDGPTEQNSLPPDEQLERAEVLLQMSRQLLRVAIENFSSKPCLSEEFLKAADLLDPADGHYEICVFCGLGGDVLCCERCPIVSHSKCVGLETIPQGDWYCRKCEGRGETESNDIDHKEIDDVTVEKALDNLRGLRQKDKIIEEAGKVESSSKKAMDNEQDPSDEELQPIVIKSGMRIVKRALFERVGEVISLPNKNGTYYEVRFEDGEVEKVEYENIKEGIALYNSLGGNDVFESNGLTTPSRRRRQRRKLVRYGSGPPSSYHQSLTPTGGKGSQGYLQSTITNQSASSREEKKNTAGASAHNAQVKRKRGRPRKNEVINETEDIVVRKRKLGRPTKTKPDIAPTLKSKRGRPSKAAPDTTPTLKSKRGRPRKIAKKESLVTLSNLQWTPKAGFVDPSLSYYCTVENDTTVTIARKVGVKWFDVANDSENNLRFPSLNEGKRTKFRKHTLIRIPVQCDTKVVRLLIE